MNELVPSISDDFLIKICLSGFIESVDILEKLDFDFRTEFVGDFE